MPSVIRKKLNPSWVSDTTCTVHGLGTSEHQTAQSTLPHPWLEQYAYDYMSRCMSYEPTPVPAITAARTLCATLLKVNLAGAVLPARFTSLATRQYMVAMTPEPKENSSSRRPASSDPYGSSPTGPHVVSGPVSSV